MPDRHAHLRKKYNMSLEHYDWLLDKQKGVCAICGGCPVRKDGLFVIDHDHKTGKVRGLLCDNCNKAVGLMRESTDSLRRAADYIDGRSLIDVFAGCDLPEPQPRKSGYRVGVHPKKLNTEFVNDIRSSIEKGVTQEVLAKKYKVSQVMISRIKLKKAW